MPILPDIDYSVSNRRIDVWFVRALPEEPLPRFRDLLSPDEVERARAFQFDHLRRNYIIIHGILRMLIGRYLGLEPAKVRFSVAPDGKPHIDPPHVLQFNLSHSADIALFGFAGGCELGVDVEKIRPMEDLLDVASRFFCPEETRELLSLPAYQRERAFYLCWTRKEAYLKAVGDGLRTPLDSFRVSLLPSEFPISLHLNGSREAAENWTLHSLDGLPTCAAALAYLGPQREVRVMPPLLAADL